MAEQRIAPTDAGKKLLEVQDWFTYHQPTLHQINVMTAARNQFKELATFLVLNVADSRERAIALTELRTAAMLVNQAIMFERGEPDA